MMVRFFSLWHFAAVKSCCFLWIIAAQKRDLQLQNLTRESWKFPYSVWWKFRHLWWSNPLSSFQYPSSIKSLILALFNSVLSPKKNPSNQAHELGLNPSRNRILYFHIRYSNGNILSFWYWNQAIQKPKFIYVSRTTTLM
jgi:hypothetical protein